MANSQVLPGWLFAIPGIFVQTFGIFSGDLGLSLVGSFLLVVGLGLYIRRKGYNFLWGLWGLVPLVGPLLILIQADRNKAPEAAMRGGAVLMGAMCVAGVGFMWVSAEIIVGNWSLWNKAEPPAPAPVVAQQVQVQPEPEPPPAPPAPPPVEPAAPAAPTSFEEGYRQVKPGMTYDEVCKLCGDDTMVVGKSNTMKVVRWKVGRQAFTARFIDDKLDMLSSLQLQNPTLSPAALEEMRARSIARLENRPEPAQDETGEGEETAEESQAGAEAGQEAAPITEEEAPPAKKGVVTGKASGERVVRIGSKAAEEKPRRPLKKAHLPRFSGQINKGANDVIFVNRGENRLRVGVRLENRGIDFEVAPGDFYTLFLKNGTYQVYYVDMEEPQTLHPAGNVVVDSPPAAIEVQLPK